MDDLTEASSDYVPNSWVTWFLATKGNEYFCEVDEDYILDRFNLTGLNAEVQHYPQALVCPKQWREPRNAPTQARIG